MAVDLPNVLRCRARNTLAWSVTTDCVRCHAPQQVPKMPRSCRWGRIRTVYRADPSRPDSHFFKASCRKWDNGPTVICATVAEKYTRVTGKKKSLANHNIFFCRKKKCAPIIFFCGHAFLNSRVDPWSRPVQQTRAPVKKTKEILRRKFFFVFLPARRFEKNGRDGKTVFSPRCLSSTFSSSSFYFLSFPFFFHHLYVLWAQLKMKTPVAAWPVSFCWLTFWVLCVWVSCQIKPNCTNTTSIWSNISKSVKQILAFRNIECRPNAAFFFEAMKSCCKKM